MYCTRYRVLKSTVQSQVLKTKKATHTPHAARSANPLWLSVPGNRNLYTALERFYLCRHRSSRTLSASPRPSRRMSVVASVAGGSASCWRVPAPAGRRRRRASRLAPHACRCSRRAPPVRGRRSELRPRTISRAARLLSPVDTSVRADTTATQDGAWHMIRRRRCIRSRGEHRDRCR